MSFPAAGSLNDLAAQEGAWYQLMEDWLAATKNLPGGLDEQAATLAADAFTPTRFLVKLDTQGGAATDDLASIGQGTLDQDGAVLYIRSTDAARVITVKHNAGANPVFLTDGIDTELDDPARGIWVKREGTSWREIPCGRRSLADGVVVFTEVAASPRVVRKPESGKVFKSDSAAAAQNYLTLPAASTVGLRARVASDSTFGFRATAAGTDTIQRGTATSGAGSYYHVAADGTFVTLLVWKSGQWVVESEIGTAGAVV